MPRPRRGPSANGQLKPGHVTAGNINSINNWVTRNETALGHLPGEMTNYISAFLLGYWLLMLKFLSVVFASLLLLLTSCSSTFEEKVLNLKTGMTYDEVEDILGKPIELTRGVTALQFDIEQLSLDELYSVLPTISTTNADKSISHIRQQNEERRDYYRRLGALYKRSTGSGIAYEQSPELAELQENLIESSRELDKQINKMAAEAVLVDEAIKISETQTIASDTLLDGTAKYWPARYQVITSGQLIYVTWKYDLRKDTAYTTHPVYLDRAGVRVQGSQTHYVIDMAYALLFDASSGRLAEWGYRPCSVEALVDSTIQ